MTSKVTPAEEEESEEEARKFFEEEEIDRRMSKTALDSLEKQQMIASASNFKDPDKDRSKEEWAQFVKEMCLERKGLGCLIWVKHDGINEGVGDVVKKFTLDKQDIAKHKNPFVKYEWMEEFFIRLLNFTPVSSKDCPKPYKGTLANMKKDDGLKSVSVLVHLLNKHYFKLNAKKTVALWKKEIPAFGEMGEIYTFFDPAVIVIVNGLRQEFVVRCGWIVLIIFVAIFFVVAMPILNGGHSGGGTTGIHMDE
ncbi:hypothetical protein ScalyP_jg7764 [Parmales sp. scaly parma]|nr:hypothetical protein ScalyP_jg7764 [Parmales sp. scaly parma]|tara:strand:+ start:95 stop:850 length:756 start_codon:yes stop_codon:yes gene_type:complete